MYEDRQLSSEAVNLISGYVDNFLRKEKIPDNAHEPDNAHDDNSDMMMMMILMMMQTMMTMVDDDDK